jgi:hypothetical protein
VCCALQLSHDPHRHQPRRLRRHRRDRSAENATNEEGERLIWLPPDAIAKLKRLRGPGESYSDVILRVAKGEGGWRSVSAWLTTTPPLRT